MAVSRSMNKICTDRPPYSAHANTQKRKALLLPGLWKKIFTGQQPDNTHANTYWRKASFMPGMWKRILFCWPIGWTEANAQLEERYYCLECGTRFCKTGIFNTHIRTHVTVNVISALLMSRIVILVANESIIRLYVVGLLMYVAE